MTKAPTRHTFVRSLLYRALLFAAFSQLFFPTHAPCLDIPRPKAEKKIVKLTEKGAVPRELVLTKHDSSVFFFNDFPDTPLHLALSFGKHRIHCHSNKLKLDKSGILRTTAPIPPKSFVVTCFPDEGRYEYKIHNLALAEGTQISGSILVRPAQNETLQ